MGKGFSEDDGQRRDELLNEPIIHLIMQADKVDERDLRVLLERAAASMRESGDVPRMREEDGSAMTNDDGYRRGVGIMLLNDRGDVFVGQRADVSEDAWQMPQGGIDEGETPREAALRELQEELGTSKAEIVAETKSWFRYDLPAEFVLGQRHGSWRGQQQKWFLMHFRGQDSDIDTATEHREFSRWQWVAADRLVALVVPFRRQLYVNVLQEFVGSMRGTASRRAEGKGAPGGTEGS